MRMLIWSRAPLAAALLGVFLSPSPALAGPTETASATFNHEENLTDLKWDTGWVPSGEKIQVKLVFTVKAGVHATLPVDATLERPGALTYSGAKDAAELKMGLWTHLSARYRIQNLKWEGISLDNEGDLPVPSSFHNKLNNIIEDKDQFTPLLLPGATPRPIDVELAPPKFTLLTLEVPVISIGIAKVSVKVPIKVQPILQCQLRGERVETVPGHAPQQTLVHDSEGKSVPWPHDQSLQQQGQATYHAKRTLAVILGVYPEIQVKAKAKIGPFEESETWDVAEFELKQKLFDTSANWTLAPQPLSWTFPKPPPGSDAGTIEPPNPDSGSGVDHDGGVTPPAGDGAVTAQGDGGSGPGAGPAQISGGCRLVSGRGLDSMPVWLLVGLLLVGATRRHKRTN
jgi:hypothetical protein